MITQAASTYMDTVIESFIVQQGRLDPVNGQQDLQAYRLIFFGFGIMIGGTTSAFAEEYYTPYHVFFILTIVNLIISGISLILSDDLETNAFAVMIDPAEEEFIRQHTNILERNGENDVGGTAQLSFSQILKMRFQTMKAGVKVPLVSKFYLFLIL